MGKYRFKFQISEEGSPHVIEQDWVTFDKEDINQFGGCESIDMAIGKMLRFWATKGQADYEKKVYGDE